MRYFIAASVNYILQGFFTDFRVSHLLKQREATVIIDKMCGVITQEAEKKVMRVNQRDRLVICIFCAHCFVSCVCFMCFMGSVEQEQ